jgi:hypothetical protein
MSLYPVLNRTTFAPLPVQLSLEDYFNPALNTEFFSTSSLVASEGSILVSDYISISKSLTSTVPYADFLTNALPMRGVPMEPESLWRNLALYSYELLPEEHKYLAPQMSFTYDTTDLSGIATFQVRITYPESIRNTEARRNNRIVPFKTRKINDHCYEPLAEDKDRFAAELLLATTFVHDRFQDVLNVKVYNSDTLLNQFVVMFYKFANNRPIYMPTEDTTRNFGMTLDWMRATDVIDFCNEPGRIRVTNRSNWAGLRVDIRAAPGDRRMLEQTLNYSANVLMFLPYTIKGPKEPTATLYGVELEACSDYTPKDVIAAQKDLFFICKSDSTITGSKGYCYEMVTVPASLRTHKRLWAEFFEKVDYRNFDTTKNTGNGMHVHIDRKTFKKDHLNRFSWFIINPANKDFLFSISERPTRRNMEDWASTPNCFNYGSKNSVARRAVSINGRTRGAVHYKGDKTVEVRIFKGIVSYATVVKNLEFVDSVVEFTRVTSTNKVTLRDYFSWVSSLPSNKYTVLRAFFAEANVTQYLPLAELTEYVWSATDDEDVTEKLNRAPFKVTNEHITALNKRKRKRTFILKNGVVTCLSKRGGMLAKLDLDIQKKQTRGAATFAITNV